MRLYPAVAAALFAATLAAPAQAEPFTYQGSLTENAQPADGVYDLRFQYHTTLTGGSPLLTETVDNVTVTEGVFQVTLPMPPSDDARFLQLAVRDGASTGGYTELLPRTFIASAPYATKALNVEWELNTSNFLTFGNGNDVVLINRENRIGSEYFGIGADTAGFAGMYIATTGATGRPFYGYNAGSAFETFAYHYLDGASGSLRFNLNGFDAFVMNTDGSFVAPSSVTSDAFTYNSPKPRTYSVAMAAFKPSEMSTFIPYVAGGFAGLAYILEPGNTQPMVAPINLPDGARITNLTARINDGSSSRSLQVQLRRTLSSTGEYLAIGAVGTTVSEFFNGVRSATITGSSAFVNNEVYGYEIQLVVGGNGWSPTPGSISVAYVGITYTVEEPD